MNFFDFLNDINYNKQGIMTADNEKAYLPFMVNRGLSYFADTVLQANELNRLWELDKRLQYDFLLNIVRKRKRFSKWFKKLAEEDLKLVMEYYGFNHSKAEAALKLLTKDQLLLIKQELEVSHE